MNETDHTPWSVFLIKLLASFHYHTIIDLVKETHRLSFRFCGYGPTARIGMWIRYVIIIVIIIILFAQ